MKNSIAVVGAGRMGITIATAFAMGGFKVSLFTRRSEDEVSVALQKRVDYLTAKNLSRPEMFSVSICNSFLEKDTDVVLAIEAVEEDPLVKAQILRQISRVVRADTIIATNTSSLGIEELAQTAGLPGRLIGLHFFNPADLMKLVEVVLPPGLDDIIRDEVHKILESIGKVPVEAPDSPGFIVNRILFAMLSEAIHLFSEGRVTASDIDKAITLGTGFPVGPLKLADTIGLDVVAEIQKRLSEGLDVKHWSPLPELLKRVEDGNLGRKSDVGFYDYREQIRKNGDNTR